MDLDYDAKNVELDLEQLERKDVIWTKIHRLPYRILDETYMATNLVIALCLQGQMSNLYDMRQVTFATHDISIMLPDHIVSHGEYSDNYTALLVVVSRNFYNKLINRDSFSDFYKYRYKPCYHLNDEQYEKISAIMRTLQIVIDSDSPKRLDMVANMLDVLFYALSYYRQGDEYERNSRKDNLFQRFYDLLIANYREQHEVAWYADRLCLTPKHFSTIVRKSTGQSAGEWIANVLHLQAKTLLRTRHDLNMQEIADILGFSGNASFCRFFRRMSGVSPLEYRNK